MMKSQEESDGDSAWASRLKALCQSIVVDDSAPSRQEEKDLAQELGRQPESGVLHLVEHLGPALTHKEAVRRRKALEFLSAVLAHLPGHALNGSQIHFLTRFFQDRLNDSSLMYSGVVCGFHALHRQDQMQDPDLLTVLRAFFDSIHAQSLLTEDRSRIFDVLTFVIRERADLLVQHQFESPFLLGFMQSVEGETHPRHLLDIFTHWPRLIGKIDVSPVVEDVFDLLACYFPVDFDQPSGRNLGVSRADLAEALQEALVSTTLFAPFIWPLLFDKMGSDLPEAKVDAYRCLARCLAVYSPEMIQPQLRDIWGHAKQEIMGIRANARREVIDQALAALANVTRNLTSAVQSPTNVAIRLEWCEWVWTEMKNFLKFTESGLFENSVLILTRISQVDPLVSEFLLERTFSVLTEVFDKTEEKARVLAMIALSLDGYHARSDPPVWQADGSLVALCEKAILNPSVEVREQGVRTLIKINSLWSDEKVVQWLKEAFARGTQESNFVGIPCWQDLMVHLAARESTLPVVKTWLQEQLPISSEDTLPHITLLAAQSDDLFPILLPEMLKSSERDNDLEEAVIQSLTVAFRAQPAGRISAFLEQDALRVLSAGPSHSIATQDLLSELTREITDDEQAHFVKDSLNNFMQDVRVNLPTDNITAIICSLTPAMAQKMDGVPEMFSEEGGSQENAMKIRGSLLNKLDLGDSILDYVTSVEAAFPKYSSWIVRGLGMRGHKRFGSAIEGLLKTFRLQATSDLVPEFMNVVRDEPLFSTVTHHTCLPFYRQKFFMKTYPTLMKMFQVENVDSALEAILVQLPFIPSSVVESEISPLIPALAQSLFDSQKNHSCETGLSAAATGFIDFLQKLQPETLSGMGEIVIPFLLQIANASNASLADRISALRAITKTHSDKIPAEVKRQVIMGTGQLRDHPKRLVRQAAVQARNQWMNDFRE